MTNYGKSEWVLAQLAHHSFSTHIQRNDTDAILQVALFGRLWQSMIASINGTRGGFQIPTAQHCEMIWHHEQKSRSTYLIGNLHPQKKCIWQSINCHSSFSTMAVAQRVGALVSKHCRSRCVVEASYRHVRHLSLRVQFYLYAGAKRSWHPWQRLSSIFMQRKLLTKMSRALIYS